MKEKKLRVAIVISSAVAVVAIVALILSLAGVFQDGIGGEPETLSEADKWREAAQQAPENAGLYAFQVVGYLETIGSFSVEDSSAEYGTIIYRYSTDDGVNRLTLISTEMEFEYTEDLDITTYSYYKDGEDGRADIGEPETNEGPESMNRYADFLDWCDEIALSPEQILEALDWYESDYKLDKAISQIDE